MNHRALYRHFPAREALLGAVAGEGFRLLAHTLSGAPDVREFLARFTRFVVTRAHLYELMTSPAGRRAVSPHAPDTPVARVIALSLAVLARGLVGDAARDMVFKVWGVVHGLAMLYRTGMLRARSREAAIAYIADAARDIVRGVTATPCH